MFAVQPGVSERLEGGTGKVVYTSLEGLRRNLAQFGFQLFKLHLDLSKIGHKERHPPFNQPVQTGPSQRDVQRRSTRAGFLAAAGWFVVLFTLGPEIFGVLLRWRGGDL